MIRAENGSPRLVNADEPRKKIAAAMRALRIAVELFKLLSFFFKAGYCQNRETTPPIPNFQIVMVLGKSVEKPYQLIYTESTFSTLRRRVKRRWTGTVRFPGAFCPITL